MHAPEIFKGLEGTAVYAVTAGAGTMLQDKLWMSASPSQWLVGCRFLYSAHDTADFLGYTPEKYVTREAAIELALAAYYRACQDSAAAKKPRHNIGLALTAAVSSLHSPAHRGGHRAHLAIASNTGVTQVTVTMEPGSGQVSRWHDNETCDDAAAKLLQIHLGAAAAWPFEGDGPETVGEPELRELLLRRPVFWHHRRDERRAVDHHVLYPGSFNPVHDGHVAVAAAAAQFHDLYRDTAYAICLDTVHKSPPKVVDVINRIAGIGIADPDNAVVVTAGDALFIDKVKQHPGGCFVVGADTMATMLDPKWGPTPAEVINTLSAYGANILVASRPVNGVIHTAESVLAAAGLAPMTAMVASFIFTSVPGYDHEVSSTALRASAAASRA